MSGAGTTQRTLGTSKNHTFVHNVVDYELTLHSWGHVLLANTILCIRTCHFTHTTEPGGPDFKYREAGPEELVNPYAKSKGSQNTMKWCAWEVRRACFDGDVIALCCTFTICVFSQQPQYHLGSYHLQVLRDNPRGLTVKAIVDEIERRGLRSFEGKANPTGQVCVWHYVVVYVLVYSV